MKLSSYSILELQKLIKDIEKEIKARKAKEKKEALADLKKLAADRGFSLDELVSETGKRGPKKGSKRPVKYRHPDDASLEWTGVGRKPKWVQAFEEQHGDMRKALV